MFKVEIITVVGSFIALVPETDISQALDYVRKKVDDGAPIFLEDESLLAITDKRQVIGYRAYLEGDKVQQPSSKPDDAEDDDAPTPWKPGKPCTVVRYMEPVTYIGKTYSVIVYGTWDHEGTPYFLLYTIDGGAAWDMISEDGYKKMVEAWLEQNYGIKAKYYWVMSPGAIYDPEEAQAYLVDFVKESRGDYKPKEKNGKAWTGWKGEGGLG